MNNIILIAVVSVIVIFVIYKLITSNNSTLKSRRKAPNEIRGEVVGVDFSQQSIGDGPWVESWEKDCFHGIKDII